MSSEQTDKKIVLWAFTVAALLKDAWKLDELGYEKEASHKRDMVQVYLRSIRNRLNDLDVT